MIRTGISILDEYLKGGIPVGKTLLYYSTPPVDNDIFVMQTAYTHLADNGVCYYVTSNCSPDVVIRNFRDYGWDLKPYASRLAIVDDYSSLIGAPTSGYFNVNDPSSIESIDETISGIIDTISPGDLIAFSSLSSIIDSCQESMTTGNGRHILDYVKRWNKMSVLNGGVVIYNFTDRGYDRGLLEYIKNSLCNATVVSGSIGDGAFYGQYFKLDICDWAKPSTVPALFKVVRPGGIKIYIPKILIMGAKGAGKSTFVRAVAAISSDKSVSVDRMGTTVALDYAHVSLKGFTIDIFGTPGQERFSPIIKTLAKDAMGIVLIVDSADPQSMDRAEELLKVVKAQNVPYVIAANKQDVEGAMDPERIRVKLELSEKIPVIPTSAMDNQNVSETLEMLINRIIGVGKWPGS